MNLDLSQDQAMLRDSFARFLGEASSTARVRAAWDEGFDGALWRACADMGALAMRVPESVGGLGLGTFDAVLVMEEAGRRLASVPLAEGICAARLLALAGEGQAEVQAVLDDLVAGRCVVGLALQDLAEAPEQWVQAGRHADWVVAREGDALVLVGKAPVVSAMSDLAATGLARLDLARGTRLLLSGSGGAVLHGQAEEEWKLLSAAALSGLAREAIGMAAAYACERVAFGQPIGAYQGLSHPLADLITAIDAGRYLVWHTVCAVAAAAPHAAAQVSLAAWWNGDVAGQAVAQALHVFGGYGLTLDHDIHLYTLRAKALALVAGDPQDWLREAAGRRFHGAGASLPDVGNPGIDFDPGEEGRPLAEELDAFFNRTLTPELRARAHYSWSGHDAGVHRKLAEAGLLFPAFRAELGGRDASPHATSQLRKVFERHGWTGHAVNTTEMVAKIVDRFGSDELKRDALARIVAGRAVCALGYSEPGGGSDVFAAATRAVPDGNGWRIDGQKMFTSGADVADYVLLLTRTDPAAAKHKGLTMFLVPLKAEGVSVQPVRTIGEEPTTITFYDGVRVPDSCRLGEVNGAVRVMSAALELEHSASFEKTQHHMVEAAEALCRSLVRRGRPLIEEPAAAMRLARAWGHALMAQVLECRSLWTALQGQPVPGGSSMVKLFSSETFRRDAADLLDLTAPDSLQRGDGPAGFINLCYRHAQGTTIYAGTSEIHRSQIAERNLGLPRSRI